MPLYNYKCNKCEAVMEKFRHKSERDEEIACSECESVDCERLFAVVGNRVWLEAKDLYNQKIKPDAERMMKNMKKGKNKEFFDIYGEN